MVYRKMNVLHFALSLEIMVCKKLKVLSLTIVVFSTIRKDHNENMCKMIMGEAHLKYKIYNETYNNVRNCNKTTRTPFTLAKNVHEVEQHEGTH